MAAYKIVGDDQRECGPVSTEQLRKWLANGRVHAQTLVQTEGSAEWIPLSDCSELASLLMESPDVPIGSEGPIPTPMTSDKISRKAFASLVLGAFALPILGLVLHLHP